MVDCRCDQPDKLVIALPSWLDAYITDTHCTSSDEDRMRFVLEAARRNTAEATGGPFAAAVFEADTGALVSLGVNLVTSSRLSMLHAEMVALSLAQCKLGVYDLGSAHLPRHVLVSSTEPCAMCLGAVPWSGVVRVVTGARDCDARAIGFDEGPKVTDWQAALAARGIAVTADVCRAEAAAVLQDYAAGGGLIYNARQGD